jgi:hypothetical protein
MKMAGVPTLAFCSPPPSAMLSARIPVLHGRGCLPGWQPACVSESSNVLIRAANSRSWETVPGRDATVTALFRF